MLEAWNYLKSAPSRKEHVMGTPIILCGFIAIESASSLPFSLLLCVGEKIAGPPHEASIWSQMLCSLHISERGWIGS